MIDYDRLTLGGTARYYVSYDAEDTGRLQAQTMIDCLAQQGVTDPRVLIMNGATEVDNNAVLLDKGAARGARPAGRRRQGHDRRGVLGARLAGAPGPARRSRRRWTRP